MKAYITNQKVEENSNMTIEFQPPKSLDAQTFRLILKLIKPTDRD